MNTMRELYTQIIMDHYQRPRNHGALEHADLEEHLLNPLCGDEVTVYASLDGDRLSDVRFEGRGCSISQASASMMTGRLVGKSHREAEAEIENFKAMKWSEVERVGVRSMVGRYFARVGGWNLGLLLLFAVVDGALWGFGAVFFVEYALLAALLGLAGAHGAYFGRKIADLAAAEAGSAARSGGPSPSGEGRWEGSLCGSPT